MLNVNIDYTRRVSRNDKMYIFPFLKAPAVLPVSLNRGIFVSGSPNGSQYTERGGRLLKYGKPNHVQYTRVQGFPGNVVPICSSAFGKYVHRHVPASDAGDREEGGTGTYLPAFP
jgi:hypothetical protein